MSGEGVEKGGLRRRGGRRRGVTEEGRSCEGYEGSFTSRPQETFGGT